MGARQLWPVSRAAILALPTSWNSSARIRWLAFCWTVTAGWPSRLAPTTSRSSWNETLTTYDNGCVLQDGVDGLTDFFPRRKPKVKIASRLQVPKYEKRLRTTLTHESTATCLCTASFSLGDDDLGRLFEGQPRATRNTCHREAIDRRSTDWMEWQAGFASGAFLMPRIELTRVVRAFRASKSPLYSDITVGSRQAGQAMIARVASAFHVSREAARVRDGERGGGQIGQDTPPGRPPRPCPPPFRW